MILKNYLKITLIISCLFKISVLYFCPSLSSLETLTILIIVLCLVHTNYIHKHITICLWSFAITLFVLSIIIKFWLYFDYGEFHYLTDTPISASQCIIELLLSEVASVRDPTIIASGDVNITDRSINTTNSVIGPSLEPKSSVVDQWKAGDFRPALVLATEGLVKSFGAGVTANGALTMMGKGKVAVKVASISVASLSAVATVTEAFIAK